MGASKTTEQVALPKATGAENDILRLLAALGRGENIGGLGDLSALARGDVSAFAPTTQDRELVAQNIGFTKDIATRGLEDTLAQLSAGLDEDLTARGIAGASTEAVDKAVLRRGIGQDIASMLDRSRIEGNQALMQLPGQRAGLMLGANQDLFNRIMGGLGTALQGYQNPRMAQATRTTTQKPGGLDYFTGALGAASKFLPIPKKEQ